MPTIQKTRRMLEYVKWYQDKHYETPTMAHLCEVFNLKSPASIHRHFAVMKQRGWIRRKRYGRDVEILDHEA